jgi:hypothetical protein
VWLGEDEKYARKFGQPIERKETTCPIADSDPTEIRYFLSISWEHRVVCLLR